MTHTWWEISLIFKMTIAKFLNTCIIPFFGNPYESQWFIEDGLSGEVATVVIAVFAGEILRIIFYPKFVIKWIVRKYEASKRDKSDITQRQANMLFENDEAILGKSMSVMLVFCFIILFYMPLFPGITVIGIIGSFLLYWSLKIILLRRSVVKKQIGSSLIVNAVKILKIGSFIHAITNLIFLRTVFDSYRAPSIITLIVSI